MRTAAAVLLLAVAAACTREPAFPDRTARVTYGGRTQRFEVDACLLDGQTAYVVGRAESGATLQAVVGVEADGETGVPASTGLTVDGFDVVGLVAFGDEAWERRGGTGEAPGSIDSARIRGSRIQAAGRAATTDADGEVLAAEPAPISLDARCDARDDE